MLRGTEKRPLANALIDVKNQQSLFDTTNSSHVPPEKKRRPKNFLSDFPPPKKAPRSDLKAQLTFNKSIDERRKEMQPEGTSQLWRKAESEDPRRKKFQMNKQLGEMLGMGKIEGSLPLEDYGIAKKAAMRSEFNRYTSRRDSKLASKRGEPSQRALQLAQSNLNKIMSAMKSNKYLERQCTSQSAAQSGYDSFYSNKRKPGDIAKAELERHMEEAFSVRPATSQSFRQDVHQRSSCNTSAMGHSHMPSCALQLRPSISNSSTKTAKQIAALKHGHSFY